MKCAFRIAEMLEDAFVRDAIAAANNHLMSGVRAGNASELSKLYTEDAILMPPGAEPITGTNSICDFWEAVLAMGLKELRTHTIELDIHGTSVIERGEYRLFSEGGVLMDRGKYLVIWIQMNDAWRIHRDIWTSSQAK
jgi:ketosteroid isomerase-like protein